GRAAREYFVNVLSSAGIRLNVAAHRGRQAIKKFVWRACSSVGCRRASVVASEIPENCRGCCFQVSDERATKRSRQRSAAYNRAAWATRELANSNCAVHSSGGSMSRKRLSRSIAAFLVVFVGVSVPVWAQTGAIAGVVKDTTGAVLPGATVEA